MIDWRSIQLIAASDVLEKGEDYFYRRMCRRYSVTFFTPLTEVYSLPPIEVLRDLFEHSFEEMERDDTIFDALNELILGDSASKEAEEKLIQEQIARWEKEEKEKKPKKRKKQVLKAENRKDIVTKFDFSEEEKGYQNDPD